VIVGDANLPSGDLLKLGTTSLVPRHDRRRCPAASATFGLADPVRAFQQVSTDVDLKPPAHLADGSIATALEIQWSCSPAGRYREGARPSRLAIEGRW